jgi:hypothetical protein
MPKPKLDLVQHGISGLPVWGGRVYDELLTELQGDRGRRIFREMSEQDPIIGGVMLGIEMLSRQVPWSMAPADETDKAQEVSDFVDGCLTDMAPTFGNTLSEILSMLVYGWSWLEIVYKRREGLKPNDTLRSSHFDDAKIGWAGWAIRSQETLDHWEFENSDDTGQLVAMHQVSSPDYRDRRIPRAKSLHFTTRSRRENPEGISILRNAYRPWYIKKNLEAIEGIGIERDLAGLPVLWAPAELFSTAATPDQLALMDRLKKIVTSIKRDEQEGILMPIAYDEDGKEQYKLELLSTGGDRQFDTNAIIGRYDERIAMSMLADFILMGHQAVGSFALSRTKTGLFSTALSAMMDVIAEEVNQAAIPKLVLLNGWSLDLVPTLQHGKIEGADLSALGNFINQLASSGMQIFPNEPLETYLLKQAGLPSDPGAGQLPLPEELEGEVIEQPAQLPPQLPPTVQVPSQRDQPQPPAIHPRKPSAEIRTPAPSQPARASERRGKHFTPLAVRTAKLRETLVGWMSPEEYRDFLEAVMAAGSFSKLSAEYQEVIVRAEAANG